MRSPRGFWGTLVILLAVPVAVLVQVLSGSGSGVAVHVALAIGSSLVAASLFDFRLPTWITWVGSAAVGGLAAIFLLQGASLLLGSDPLNTFAYQVLGAWPERVFIDLFLLWLVSLLLQGSAGQTRVFGFVAVGIVVCLEAYGYLRLLLGGPADAGIPGSRALYLLPIVWLLLESLKTSPKNGPMLGRMHSGSPNLEQDLAGRNPPRQAGGARHAAGRD